MTHGAKDIDPGFARMMRGITSSIAATDNEDAPIDLGVLSGFVAPGDDQRQEIRHNSGMETPISRAELDAKLETIEVKMDGRLARIEDGFSGLERRFDKLETVLEKQKYTAWAAAGATIVAVSGIVFAAYSMGFGAFDSGRETARLAADAQTKAVQAQQETAAALTQIRQIVSDLKAAQPPQQK